jgi:hypothetical protein
MRNHKWRTLVLAFFSLVGLYAIAVFLAPQSPHYSIGADIVSVPYSANISINGTKATLNERIIIDKQAREEAHIQGNFASPKWSRGPVIDGEPTLRRQSVFNVRLPTLGAATLAIPIDLGEISQGENTRPIILEPRDASTFKITAKKGAIAATYPATTGRVDLLRDHLEETAIGIALDSSVRLAVLSPMLQNQTGAMAYQIIAWGPLPWLTGLAILVITGALWKRLTDWMDQFLSRILPHHQKAGAET